MTKPVQNASERVSARYVTRWNLSHRMESSSGQSSSSIWIEDVFWTCM